MNAAIMKNISTVRGKKKNEKFKNDKGQFVSNYVVHMLLNIQFLSAQLFTFSDDPDELYIKNLDMIKCIHTDVKMKGNQ